MCDDNIIIYHEGINRVDVYTFRTELLQKVDYRAALQRDCMTPRWFYVQNRWITMYETYETGSGNTSIFVCDWEARAGRIEESLRLMFPEDTSYDTNCIYGQYLVQTPAEYRMLCLQHLPPLVLRDIGTFSNGQKRVVYQHKRQTGDLPKHDNPDEVSKFENAYIVSICVNVILF